MRARGLAIASLLALGKRTVTGMLSAGGRQFEDWSAAYRLFEQKRIDRQTLFAPARESVLEHLSPDEPLVVMMDDTLVRKRGRKVHGTGWKRDPLGPHFCTNFVWGQRFLQLSAALPEADGQGRARGIPIDFIHAPSAVKPRKKASEETWEEYRRQQKLCRVSQKAAERLQSLREQVGGKRVVCAVDGGFTNRTMFRAPPEDTVLVGRIRKDARLFGVPEEDASRRGRRRFYGESLPTPEELRKDDSIPWQKVEAFAAGARQSFELKTLPAVRWRGTGNRTVRLVVIRPLAYRPCKGAKMLYRDPAYLLCTDPELPLAKLLQAYLWRWEIELNFRDEKTVMGVGEAHVRKPSSVESVPALVVAAYSYLLLAAAAAGFKATCLPRPKWYPPKPAERCTTQQMLALFRTQLWKIAMERNLTHFASTAIANRTPVYSENSLALAICHARK